MKHNFHLSFLALVILAGCTKTTTVTGKITDKATGLPLEGVSVSIRAIKYKSSYDHTYEVELDADNQVTGYDGQFQLEIETKKPVDLGFGALKEGYEHVHHDIKWGKSQTLNFDMDPIDAVIRVKVLNETGYTGDTYARIAGGGFIYPWPFVLQKDESFTKLFNVSGDKFVEIRWGSKANQPLILSPGVIRDSVFCNRNDTTDFLLIL